MTANLSQEGEELYQQGRKDGLREAIELLSGLKEQRIHEMFRGLWAAVDEDGWQLLSLDERKLLIAAAKILAGRIGDPAPSFDYDGHSNAIDERNRKAMEEEMRRNAEQWVRRNEPDRDLAVPEHTQEQL